MTYKGIIFDLDGVLIHTDEFHFVAWKRVADRLNIPFDREDNDRLRGVSRMESLDIILERTERLYTAREKAMIAEEKNQYYRNLLNSLTPEAVSKTVRETLALLRRSGYLLAIGSSSKNCHLILERTNLLDCFNAISDGNNISRSKPDPEVFVKAAYYLGLPARECVVVEDARSGVDAAVQGGFACFGMGDAAGYEKATWRIADISGIPAILNRS